jgi:large subunit ribosomal protein L9
MPHRGQRETNMQLILLQKVNNLGNLGDKVDVKPGFGRNFLVPQGKAVPATAANLAEFEARRAEYEAKAEANRAEAAQRLTKLEGASVTIYANASAEGKLYGSVGPRDIAEALTKHGMPVEKSEVVMGEGAFRNIGQFEVVVHLHADAETVVTVIVAPEAS